MHTIVSQHSCASFINFKSPVKSNESPILMTSKVDTHTHKDHTHTYTFTHAHTTYTNIHKHTHTHNHTNIHIHTQIPTYSKG